MPPKAKLDLDTRLFYLDEDRGITLYTSDNKDILWTMHNSTVDAIVTDPPYGLEFMGQEWDCLKGVDKRQVEDMPATQKQLATHPHARSKVRYGYNKSDLSGKAMQEFHESWAKACFHVLKRGHYMFAFGGCRTVHRMMCALEDVGFEIIELCMWCFGSGFPKGLGRLKPAYEPIILCRKPSEGRGLKDLEIDSCRVSGWKPQVTQGINGNPSSYNVARQRRISGDSNDGRYPPNILLSHSAGCILQGTKRVKGITGGKNPHKDPTPIGIHGGFNEKENRPYFDHADGDGLETVESWICEEDCPVHLLNGQQNDVARFFPQFPFEDVTRFNYCPKASKAERNRGCENIEGEKWTDGREKEADYPSLPGAIKRDNYHPCVKPQKICEWLIKLISKEGDLIVDPFSGSGTTLIACKNLGRRCIGIDNNAEYNEISFNRLTGG